jgi:hypothetical protein
MQIMAAPSHHNCGQMAGVATSGTGYRKTITTVAEAIHAEEMGDAALLVAEFTRRSHVDDGGLDRNRELLAAANRGPRLTGLFHVGAKILRAFFVQNVVYRPHCDQNDHRYKVCLHDRWRDYRR